MHLLPRQAPLSHLRKAPGGLTGAGPGGVPGFRN